MKRIVFLALVSSASLLAGCDWGGGSRGAQDSSVRSETATRECDSRVEGRLPPPVPSHDVSIGPVTFRGLLDAARQPPGEFESRGGRDDGRTVKTVTEVDADAVVAVALAEQDREAIALIYDNFAAIGKEGFDAGSRVVRFEACPADTPALSGAGTVGARTQFNGGFIVARPGCYEIEVASEGGGLEFTRRIGFGVGPSRCGGPSSSTPTGSDGVAILRHCNPSSGVPGVDGLRCEEAQELLESWPNLRSISSSLDPCQHDGPGFDYRVDPDISCEHVAQFVGEDFAPHPAGWFERKGGFTCRIAELGGGGLTVGCTQGETWFTFKFA